VTADPFAALGLPVRPDLTDDDVRAAWRRIAAATHPDRADGGDPGRYAVASAAYADLRTRDSRGEAYADLAAGNRWRWRRARRVPPPQSRAARAGARGRTAPDTRSARGTRAAPEDVSARSTTPARDTPAPSTSEPGTRPGPGTRPVRAVARLTARIRRGRPALLAVRVAGAAGVCVAAFGIAGAEPAAAGLATGALTWLLLTARHDLRPPGNG
jgi:hypothetical protein